MNDKKINLTEQERLKILASYKILDTLPEQTFEDLVLLASQICATPIASITLIDDKRLWFKAKVGLDVSEVPRGITFCNHAIKQDEILVVPDSTKDERFKDNPLVTGQPHLRFYAGAPLSTENGYNLGTICVFDHAPRQLSAAQLSALQALSRLVMEQLEHRVQLQQRSLMEQKVEAAAAMLEDAELTGKFGSWDVDLISRKGHRSKGLKALFEIEGDPSASAYTEKIHPDDRAQIARLRDEMIHGDRRTIDMQFRLLLKDGSVRYLKANGEVRNDVRGWPTSVVGTVQDITELKQLEKKLVASRETAISAAKAKSTFLATMSHEIRTPLNGVLGSTALLLDTHLDTEQREMVETIQSSGDALLALIDDVLDFSKIEAGKIELEKRPFDIRKLAREAIKIIRPRADEKALELELIVESAVPEFVVTDGARVRQVVLNLLSNAVKFTDNGVVKIRISAGEEIRGNIGLKVVVEDQGIGMTVQQQSRIFQEFVQADASTNRRYGGTGLGLAICKHLSTLLDGDIAVESEIGVGSKFIFMLQAQVGDKQAVQHLNKSERTTLPKTFGDDHPLKILIAEDNKINQILAKKFFQKLSYQVDIVENGEAAVDAIIKGSYDTVLMDVHMPILDGYEATKRILQEVPAERRPYIIAFTANVMKSDRDKCFAAGMHDFIKKPLEMAELCGALERCIAVRSQRAVTIPAPTPIASTDDILGRFDDDFAMFKAVADIYVSDCNHYLNRILECFSAKDVKDLELAAHGLKGAAKNFSLTLVTATAARIEELARDSNIAAAEQLFDQLVTEVEQLKRVLLQLLSVKSAA